MTFWRFCQLRLNKYIYEWYKIQNVVHFITQDGTSNCQIDSDCPTAHRETDSCPTVCEEVLNYYCGDDGLCRSGAQQVDHFGVSKCDILCLRGYETLWEVPSLIVGWSVDHSQSLFYFVSQEKNSRPKLPRLLDRQMRFECHVPRAMQHNCGLAANKSVSCECTEL